MTFAPVQNSKIKTKQTSAFVLFKLKCDSKSDSQFHGWSQQIFPLQLLVCQLKQIRYRISSAGPKFLADNEQIAKV